LRGKDHKKLEFSTTADHTKKKASPITQQRLVG